MEENNFTCDDCGESTALTIVSHLLDGDELRCPDCSTSFVLPKLSEEHKTQLIDQAKADAAEGCIGILIPLMGPQLLCLVMWFFDYVSFKWAVCVGCVGQVIAGYIMWKVKLRKLLRIDAISIGVATSKDRS